MRNALAAVALALAAGASLNAIRAGLEQVQGVAGRLTRHVLPGGATLIDDSYNANPGSVRAAIDTLALEPGERWLVLGNMAELGPSAMALHEAVGRHAMAAGIEQLVTVGTLAFAASSAFGTRARHFATLEEALPTLHEAMRGGVVMLVKGSRSSAMERIVRSLLGARPDGGQSHVA